MEADGDSRLGCLHWAVLEHGHSDSTTATPFENATCICARIRGGTSLGLLERCCLGFAPFACWVPILCPQKFQGPLAGGATQSQHYNRGSIPHQPYQATPSTRSPGSAKKKVDPLSTGEWIKTLGVFGKPRPSQSHVVAVISQGRAEIWQCRPDFRCQIVPFHDGKERPGLYDLPSWSWAEIQ
uniref:Uncharacterized protein n=1 Tax=Tetraselmis sp. GSL018 TaxID=582737 RepID=A0A061S5D4_9CHLO